MNNEDKFQHKKIPKSYKIKKPIIRQFKEIDLSGTYSYANYIRWEIEERLELIKGKIFPIAAPITDHQRLIGFIYAGLYVFLRTKTCEAFVSPVDVRFPTGSKNDADIYTVLQPDVCVVCDPAKVDRRGVLGAPDLVVEVLSPSTRAKDLKNKFEIYQEFKVREYWVVDPKLKTVVKYVLDEVGQLIPEEPYFTGTTFTSEMFPGFSLDMKELFEKI